MTEFDCPHPGMVETRTRVWLEVNCAHCHNPIVTARTKEPNLRAEQTDADAGQVSGGTEVRYRITQARGLDSGLSARVA